MRFLADENIPIISVNRIKDHNFDILSVHDISRGISDSKVLELAIQHSAIIITQDRDFGQLLFKTGHSRPMGVIYLRNCNDYPENIADVIVTLIENQLELQGFFTTVNGDSVRQRKL